MTDDKRIQELEQELDELKREFRGYVERKQQDEAQRLRTALVAAGGVILALGGFIWWEIVWPAINASKS